MTYIRRSGCIRALGILGSEKKSKFFYDLNTGRPKFGFMLVVYLCIIFVSIVTRPLCLVESHKLDAA